MGPAGTAVCARKNQDESLKLADKSLYLEDEIFLFPARLTLSAGD